MNHSFNTLNIFIFFFQLSTSQNLASNPPVPTISRLLYQPPPCTEHNTIECVVSPCSYTTCPTYPNAICRDYNCGQCTAIFLDDTTGEQLSYFQCNYAGQIYYNDATTKKPTTPSQQSGPSQPSQPSQPAVTTNPIPPTTNISSISTGNETEIELTEMPESSNKNETEGEEGDEEEGEEYEYPYEVDQYQKTRDNYGVNLNDEMIDIGRDLINYGDLDINVAWPYILQSVPSSSSSVLASQLSTKPCNTNTINDTDTNSNSPCIPIKINATNGTNGTTIYYRPSAISTGTGTGEEIGDDPVVNKYAIDNVQKTRDNMGLNLNDEVVDIGRDLINYGTLHYNMVPVSPEGGKITINSGSGASAATPGVSTPCLMVHCVTSPCLQSSCPSYPSATCRDDFCDGCNAIWTNRETGQDLSFNDCHGEIGGGSTSAEPEAEKEAQKDLLDQEPLYNNIIPTDISSGNCAQDEKICGDGSIVFRQSMNNCEFSPCPSMSISSVVADTAPKPAGVQSAMQTEEQQLSGMIPCIMDEDRSCAMDKDCCGDGVCDINGKCINGKNDFNRWYVMDMEKENGTNKAIEMMTKVIIAVFLVIVLCILVLLYWCWGKGCMVPPNGMEARREVLDEFDIENQS